MKINWFSFIGAFSGSLSLRVFLICRLCLLNNANLALQLINSDAGTIYLPLLCMVDDTKASCGEHNRPVTLVCMRRAASLHDSGRRPRLVKQLKGRVQFKRSAHLQSHSRKCRNCQKQVDAEFDARFLHFGVFSAVQKLIKSPFFCLFCAAFLGVHVYMHNILRRKCLLDFDR